MGDFLVNASCCYVAGSPTFFPGAKVDNHHAILTLMANRTTRSGKQVTDQVTCNFWGKNAMIAANYLYPGKMVNVRGRLVSYTEDTGIINTQGKKKLNRRVEIRVSRVQLLTDSVKFQQKRLNQSIANMQAAGRLPAALPGIELTDLFPKKNSMVEFNPQIALQTGRYGYAQVWSKDRGSWQPGATGAGASTGADVVDNQQLINMIKTNQALLANANAMAGPDISAVDNIPIEPFA